MFHCVHIVTLVLRTVAAASDHEYKKVYHKYIKGHEDKYVLVILNDYCYNK